MNFEEARAQFPVLDRIAYLNTGTNGPLAQATVNAMVAREQADLEQGRSGQPYIDEMSALRLRVREGLAATIAVPAKNLALTASTTQGCNIVLAGLGLGPGDEVVTTDTEHFGLLGPLQASGATIRVARIRDLPTEQALAAIRAEVRPRTRLLALSHVSWLTGNVLPVEELREETGLPMLVDGAQTAGAIPVEAARYDFYTVSGQKWLCGPDATGALYVRDPDELRIAFPTHFSQSFYDESGAYTAKPGAARFDGGWIPVPSLAGLEAALGTIPHWAAHRAAEAASRCWAMVAERFRVVTAPGQATLVSFVADGDPAKTAARLLDEGVVIRDLPGTGWLRASCGWWTSGGDLDRMVSAL